MRLCDSGSVVYKIYDLSAYYASYAAGPCCSLYYIVLYNRISFTSPLRKTLQGTVMQDEGLRHTVYCITLLCVYTVQC